MKHRENLKWIAARLVNYEVREEPIKQEIPAGEVSAVVARDLDDDPVCGFQAFPFEKVEPDGVDVKDPSSVS